MSFLLNRRIDDFARELNFDQLLAVNGGCGGSFSGDSGYTGVSGENHGYNSYGSGGSGSSSSGSGSCNGSGSYSGGSSSSGSGSCSGSGSYSGGSSSSGSGSCSGTGSYNSGSSSSSSSGTCSGSGGNNTLLNAIEKESGAVYNNNCDDWAISVLNDADITIGTTALKGDKTCQIRQEELIAQCNNELTSYTQMQTGTWYLGCSSTHMFLVSRNSNNTYTIADSTGCSCWNNSKAGIHGIGNYADSQTYGASNAVYVPLPQ
jgi:hypothetical protein